MKDIYDDTKIEYFIKNMTFCMLREKEEKDISLNKRPIFEIPEMENYEPKFFNSFSESLGNQLNNEEFNEIFIKKSKLPLIYNTQKKRRQRIEGNMQKYRKNIKCIYPGYQPDITELIKKFLMNKKN